MTDYLQFEADLADPEVADAFDDFTYWSSLFGQLLFRHLRLGRGLQALDVGCGTGFPLLELADRLGPSSSVHGIDAWPQAIARSQKKIRVRRHDNVRVVCADASEMPYDDASFDLIVSNLGLNNFDSPERVMQECRRVAKTGARLALTTNVVGHMDEFYRLFESVLEEAGLVDCLGPLQQQEAHRGTVDSVRDLLEGGGFPVTQCRTEEFTLRYADGAAFLRAYLTKVGFLAGWRSVVGSSREGEIFDEIESRLNRLAESRGGLDLSIPAVFLEGQRV